MLINPEKRSTRNPHPMSTVSQNPTILMITMLALQERTARTETQNEARALLQKLPVYKWLVALPQLTSRICHPNTDVRTLTHEILKKVAAAFPQQAGPCMLVWSHHQPTLKGMLSSCWAASMHMLAQAMYMDTKAMLRVPYACLEVHLRKGAGSHGSAPALVLCNSPHTVLLNFRQLLQALWAMAALAKSKQQARREAAGSIMAAAARASDKAKRALFQQFGQLQDHLIHLCNHQPPGRVKCAPASLARADLVPDALNALAQ